MVTVATVVAGALIWLIRLEGRVNAQDLQLQNSFQQNQQIRQDLQYIRQRLDQALDGGVR